MLLHVDLEYEVGECTFPSDIGPTGDIAKENKTCAPGRVQFQIRNCQDGTGGGDSDDEEDRRNEGDHICKDEEKSRFIKCEIDECINASKTYETNGKGNVLFHIMSLNDLVYYRFMDTNISLIK